MDSLHRVELVPDDEPAPTGRAAPAGTPPGLAAPARRRTRAVVVAVLLAALLLTLVAVGSWRTSTAERARLARPGAVVSLAVPPEPAWETDAAAPRLAVVADGDGAVLAVVTGERVEGYDVETGARRWAALDATAWCGPAAGETSAPASRPGVVTCLTGPALAPVAHVLGPRGPTTDAVPLGDDLGRAVPAPDGTVLRWSRTGGVVHLALQDARTAQVRWYREIQPDDAQRTAMCRPQVAGQAAVTVEDDLLVVRGCRLSAVLTLAGTRLDARGDAITTGVISRADGTFWRTTVRLPDRTGSTQLVAPDGTVRTALSGHLLVPLVGPGRDATTWFVTTPAGVRALEAPAGQGTDAPRELWRVDLPAVQVVALAAERVVLAVDGTLVALDARTGERAWSWPRAVPEESADRASGGPDLRRGVTAAFTDGATLAVVVPDLDSPRRALMTGLSLDDGGVRWQAGYDADPHGFAPVAGRVVHVDPGTSRVVVHG
ncbi:PQQ-binding-like beta-propeller repeat protein [Cellulosimicrobium protaetiae]|uniref:PQQ-binding-like beta-propeller repeat protein n=1 Tax=Cellulosimicrobium protaetiae TaxID=2587808 RepID=A0A6M5UHM6_9MICO|nr:PQQ-binding-like beta-propeller repeat protein [Cellulosimicrobium protaetiae]QJW36815.1 PQQ-binding-like beta-propeller repeat protein [Cellulosimicrobium protaetiae]